MKITIKGHPTRGQEVIQILENLGGRNISNHNGKDNYAYYISSIDRRIYKTSLLFSEYKHYTLEEFEKEFPFKVGDRVVSLTTGLIGTITKFSENEVYQLKYDNGMYTLANACYLKLYKEMKKERNITLTLSKAREWYQKGGELREVALQAFTEEELNPLPRSWEEFCKQGHAVASWRDNIPIKYEVLFQLEQLRNCWLSGWEPKWDTSEKWCIRLYKNQLHVGLCTDISRFLTFPTREMAEDFLKCFWDLIETARNLI